MLKSMPDIDFSIVEEFVRKAGDRALKDWDNFSVVQYKNRGLDLSTNIDLEIEKEFYELCKLHFPDFGFKGEEYPQLINDSQSGYVWHIDPIDGTKNFVNEVPLWSVTVSLVSNGSPVFGIIYNPVTKQFYSARKGAGAYLNARKLKVQEIADVSRQQLAIDFFMPQPKPLEKDMQDALLAELYGSFYRVRSIGSGSLSLAWLAQGHFGAYFSWGLTNDKFTDIAAGLIIAEEAGANVIIQNILGGKLFVAVGSPEATEFLKALVLNLENK